MNIDLHDHSDEVLAALQEAAERALEKCGLVAEGYAKRLAPVDTGNLRNSITHKVDPEEPAVYIGTNSVRGAGHWQVLPRRAAHPVEVPGCQRQLALDGG